MKQWYYDKHGIGVIADEKPEGYDFDFRGKREYEEEKVEEEKPKTVKKKK